MNTFFVLLFLTFFALLSWRRFFVALAVFFFLLPSYLIRFSLGPLPTTLLELMFGIIVFFWLINLRQKENRELIGARIHYLVKEHKFLLASVFLFLIAATIGVIVSINKTAALGEWKAFYIEPVLLAFVLFTSLPSHDEIPRQARDDKNEAARDDTAINKILFALILSGFFISLVAIYQHFTGWLVPYDFWQNRDTYRVTVFWGFPNAVGIYLGPLLPLAIYFIKNQKWSGGGVVKWLSIFVIPLALVAIFYAKSTGALIGVTAGLGFLLLINKWTKIPTVIAGLAIFLFVFFAPQASSIKQEILLQDYSGGLRINIWAETVEFLSDHPVFGAGLASYQKLVYPYRIDKWIEVFHHPHNQFLTMWVNLGFLGFVSFILILFWFFDFGLRNLKQNSLTPFVLAAMIVFVIMGLVDSPYIKNDTSMIFWLFISLILMFSSSPYVGGDRGGY